MHYEADLPQNEIARQLGLSTATVSRLLRRARDEGIVNIEIRAYETTADTAKRIKRLLRVRRVEVVDGPEAGIPPGLASSVGSVLKDGKVGDGSILALGWGRAVRDVIRMGLPGLPGVITIPATGGMQQAAPHFQINEFVRLAAEQLGGTPQFIHAPYLPSSQAREAFLREASIRERVELWDKVDAAVVGVGLPHKVDPVHAGAATSSELALTNVAGDVVRHYFDANGNIIPWKGGERVISISVEQLRAVPIVIGVAASPGKANAIIGAVRARLINVIVTDRATAAAILAKIEIEPGSA
ncbi:sugar-binding transcriptional regulator [Lichenicoccus sp.]|uniref:sugar-binding transcriptional regulator n=1 Tax=Lichenicoccus sp. TaxID=2781899 RepID=UPI003D0DEFD2